jgi:hypothetical protein
MYNNCKNISISVGIFIQGLRQLKNQTPWPESASELYRQSDRRLSVKLVPTFADKRCHVVSAADPYGRNLGFLDRQGLRQKFKKFVISSIHAT